MVARPVPDDDLRETMRIHRECGGSINKTAQVMQLSWNSVEARLRRAAERGLDEAVPPHGFAVTSIAETTDADGNVRSRSVRARPEAGPAFEVPVGHMVKGVSALVDAEGRVVQRWFKTREGDTDPVAIVEAMRLAAESIKPLAPVTAPERVDDDLACILPVADLHAGQKSDGQETGDDYSLSIARNRVMSCVRDVTAMTPPCHTAALVFLGDTIHADDNTAQTPASKHSLDVDSRTLKVLVEVAETAIDCVRILAARHRNVIVRVLPGNHDPHAALGLAVGLHFAFLNDPRITLDLDRSLYWYFEWGCNLIGGTHGHTIKLKELPGAMASHMPKAWGRTSHRVFFVGHRHSFAGYEGGGVRCIQVPPLTSPDAYAAGRGYASARGLTAHLLHKGNGPQGSVDVLLPPVTLEARP